MGLVRNSGLAFALKTENLQITGSFKVRGAYYKMSCLTKEEKERGVIACSAGNHAQGVALAAKEKYNLFFRQATHLIMVVNRTHFKYAFACQFKGCNLNNHRQCFN